MDQHSIGAVMVEVTPRLVGHLQLRQHPLVVLQVERLPAGERLEARCHLVIVRLWALHGAAHGTNRKV